MFGSFDSAIYLQHSDLCTNLGASVSLSCVADLSIYLALFYKRVLTIHHDYIVASLHLAMTVHHDEIMSNDYLLVCTFKGRETRNQMVALHQFFSLSMDSIQLCINKYCNEQHKVYGNNKCKTQ